jgi:hypothetical protein
MPLNDKRKTVRIKQSLSILYPCAATNKQQWHRATVSDISEVGLSMVTPVRFAVSAYVDILLRAPFKPIHWLEIHTRVVGCQAMDKKLPGAKNSKGYLIHLKFAGLSAAYKELLRVYIAWVLSKNLK